MIPPFVSQLVGVIVRAAVIWIAGYLAAHAGVSLTEDQIGTVVAYLSPALAMLAWALYRNYRGRLKLATAQVARGPVSERELDAMINDPHTPNPSLLAGKDEVPK